VRAADSLIAFGSSFAADAPPVRPVVIPLTDVHESMKLDDSYDGEPEDSLLPVSEALLDPVGIYMALVTDRVLARGWEPNGFEQCSGYRVYRYKRME
jgi:hypothetical protein